MIDETDYATVCPFDETELRMIPEPQFQLYLIPRPERQSFGMAIFNGTVLS